VIEPYTLHRRFVLVAIIVQLLVACATGEDGVDGEDIFVPDRGDGSSGDGGSMDATLINPACAEPGCACEPGTLPKSCYPEPTYTPEGTKLCAQGTMTCRAGNWSSCETLANYDLSFARSVGELQLGRISSALVADAATCNACNPNCFVATTAPVTADLTASNSSNVDYSPIQGGITLHVLVNGTQRGSGSATAVCGNGTYENGINGGVEECDDGNVTTLDGCDANCRLEKNVDWFCPTPGSPCKVSSCGNAVREGSEPCDDGNDVIGDGCGLNCVAEPSCPVGSACSSSCGDGIKLASDVSEACDDGNPRSNDGCSSTCQVEAGYTCTDVTGTLPANFPLTVTFRDFVSFPINGTTKHPDFENASYSAPLGLVNDTLTSGKPTCVATAGTCRTALTTAANFNQWYANAEINNVMKKYVTTMNMAKQGATTAYKNTPLNSQLFPLDGRLWTAANKESTNSGHNFGFTSEIHHWFQFKGGEVLTFSGDDDVWVFIGGKLALDIGGVHGSISRTIRLNASGSVDCFEGTAASGTTCATATRALGLQVNSVYEMALFHAERHTSQSNFDLTLNGFVATKSSCVPFCGDGVITTLEFCDDGVALNGLAGKCFADCSGRASKYVTSASYFRDYTATGTCKIPPERPLWGALTWTGDATLGGTIAFKLQGAETAAGLTMATPVTVTLPTTATSGSFDVRTTLAGAGLQADVPYLRVTALLTSSADQKNTPVLRQFDVSHTCVNAQ
jgi:fibro-slime domain-containing protein